MSTHRYKKTIQSELERLNNRIDYRIIRGLPYTKESKRHKFLLKQLYGLNAKRSWFQSMMQSFV